MPGVTTTILLFVLSAAAAPLPSWCAAPPGRLEASMLHDAEDGRLDEFSLLDAALIAGGAEDEHQVDRLRRQFDHAARRLHARLAPSASDREKAEAALQLLHESFLVGRYQAECSRPQTTLAHGDYNCVTATILYHSLCDRIGLNPAAVSAPAHVFTRICGEKPLDVETTCATWFDSPQKPNVGGWRPRGASPNTSVDQRELNAAQLVGKIYYNEGVELLHQHRYRQAVGKLQRSLRLDPLDRSARDNLLAAFNNWALDECAGEHFERALLILSLGFQIDPDYQPYHRNDLHIHQKWVQHLCRRHQYPSAVEVLQRGQARRPQEAIFQDGLNLVYAAWLQWLLENDQLAESAGVLANAAEISKNSDLARSVANVIREHVRRLVSAERPAEAAALSEAAHRAWGDELKVQFDDVNLTAPVF